MLKPFSFAGVAAAALLLGVAGCQGLSDDADAGPGPAPGTSVGPALQVTDAMLTAALACTAGTGATAGQRNPVLLIHSTGLTAEQTWGGNYAKVLPEAGYNTCNLNLPNKALDDIQVSAEYVVLAVRRMNTQYSREVNVLAHSQGGLEARWALKYWPDMAGKIDDVVSLGTPNHGSSFLTEILCLTPDTCTEAVNQQLEGANFLAALNANESVPAGVSYTSIYSRTDEIVINLAEPFTSAVSGASNILIQDVCPLRSLVTTHLQLLTAGPVYALVLDAFANAGAANPTRLDQAAVCATITAPGVTISDFLVLNSLNYVASYTSTVTGDGAVEPPLASYVTP